MSQAIELSLEQEFSIKSFANQVQHLSLEQAKECLIEQHRLMLVQQTMYQELLKHEWKLDAGPASL
jgi:hypothetical protein